MKTVLVWGKSSVGVPALLGMNFGDDERLTVSLKK